MFVHLLQSNNRSKCKMCFLFLGNAWAMVEKFVIWEVSSSVPIFGKCLTLKGSHIQEAEPAPCCGDKPQEALQVSEACRVERYASSESTDTLAFK